MKTLLLIYFIVRIAETNADLSIKLTLLTCKNVKLFRPFQQWTFLSVGRTTSEAFDLDKEDREFQVLSRISTDKHWQPVLLHVQTRTPANQLTSLDNSTRARQSHDTSHMVIIQIAKTFWLSQNRDSIEDTSTKTTMLLKMATAVVAKTSSNFNLRQQPSSLENNCNTNNTVRERCTFIFCKKKIL